MGVWGCAGNAGVGFTGVLIRLSNYEGWIDLAGWEKLFLVLLLLAKGQGKHFAVLWRM